MSSLVGWAVGRAREHVWGVRRFIYELRGTVDR